MEFKGTKTQDYFKLVDLNCVNSLWPPYWLQKKGIDSCQCGFECKVKVEIKRNLHPTRIYVVTKKEYNKLRKELRFIAPSI